jgi:hypothetical protein
MAAHIACRPDTYTGHADTGCFVVCTQHRLRVPFGAAHAVAVAACREHNVAHHPERFRVDPPLLSVVYRSVRAADAPEVDLPALLAAARRANRASGITGMLLTQDGRFLQALEGPEPVVRRLLASIARDPRHEQVTVLADEIVRARRFPDWAMAEGGIGGIEARPLAAYYEGLLIARGAVTS